MILLLLACAHDAPGDTGGDPAFAPAYGDWTLHLGARWDDGCALSDPHTYFDPESVVEIGAYRYGFSMLDEEGYWTPCALDGRDFTCALPAVTDDFRSGGYDLVATYTPTMVGTFSDPEALDGVYQLHATCEGADCGILTGFGPDYAAPCTVTTPMDAELAGE